MGFLFQFSQQVNPIFPVTAVEIATKTQKMVVVEAPFIEELSGMAMVKILDMKNKPQT